MMRRALFLILIALFFSFNTHARYTKTSKLKYKTDYSWSDYYTVDVIFMSGSELNRATKTFKYDSFTTYAIIFWKNDEATIIKISSFTGCGTEVNESCIINKVTNLEGEDQNGRGWEICTGKICF